MYLLIATAARIASAMANNGTVIFAVLLLLLLALGSAEARKGQPIDTTIKPAHKHAKHHDVAHASRKYRVHKDPISGRTAAVIDAPKVAAPAGRKLRQTPLTGTTVAPGMTVCLPAADAANFMVGSHATQMTVSNAVYSAGQCDISTCTSGVDAYGNNVATCSTGLQWGIVQTWPQDHAMAAMFGNTGALTLTAAAAAAACPCDAFDN